MNKENIGKVAFLNISVRANSLLEKIWPEASSCWILWWKMKLKVCFFEFAWTAKIFAVSVLVFFSFSFSSYFFEKLARVLWVISVSCSCRHVWQRSGVLHWTHWLIIVVVLKFRVWEHIMPCDLGINSNCG